jgi:putative transposase
MSRLRLDPEGEYAAVRCAVEPGESERTRKLLESSGSLSGRPAVLALDEEHCVGVVARRPQAGPDQLVGLGPFVPLARIARSYEVAQRAVTVASALHRTGVQGVEELTWRLAAAEHSEVGRVLWRRCLEPLRREGRFGTEIEESVRTYLRRGRNIPRAAQDLVLHVNTLRYRLRRFTELTGLRLDDPDDLVQVVWALEFSEFADFTGGL